MTDREEPSIEDQARLAEMIAIVEQNDLFRKKPTDNEASGRWVYTAAINEQGHAFLEGCVKAVGEYTCVFRGDPASDSDNIRPAIPI